jgi:hypothetical protein
MRFVGSRLSIGFVSVAAAAFAAVPSALASPPGADAGTVQLGPPTVISETMTGKVVVSEQVGSLTFTGTITGTGTLEVLSRLSPAGKETFSGGWTAPVTLADGRSGTLSLAVHGRDNGTFSGTFVARGSDGLDGLVGQGKFSGQDATGAGTYTFHYNK